MATRKQPRRRIRRAEIVAAARGWIGTPYSHQASLKGAGADCLGLLRGVWREFLGAEPEEAGAYTPAWAELGTGDALLEAACRHLVGVPDGIIRPGSVLVFRWRDHVAAKHCGIATGPAHFIHAHDGASVSEVALIPAWRRRIAGVFDFPNLVADQVD